MEINNYREIIGVLKIRLDELEKSLQANDLVGIETDLFHLTVGYENLVEQVNYVIRYHPNNRAGTATEFFADIGVREK